jgi:hypothetical protein
MVGDEHAAPAADAQQAAHFRRYLQEQRAELAQELTQHMQDLNRYISIGGWPSVSHVRSDTPGGGAAAGYRPDGSSAGSALPRAIGHTLNLNNCSLALRSTNSGM